MYIGNYLIDAKTSISGSYNIKEGTTVIAGSAFYGCTKLTSITIPDSVTSIGDSAFFGCTSLTSITIPDGVTSIGGYAFYNCKSLESITIPDGITSIDRYAFYDCTSLTSITIPDGVTSIDHYAFYDCTSLESVYYSGTADKWSAISISSNNTCLTSATIYYYSETQPTVEGNYWHYVNDEIVIWTDIT